MLQLRTFGLNSLAFFGDYLADPGGETCDLAAQGRLGALLQCRRDFRLFSLRGCLASDANVARLSVTFFTLSRLILGRSMNSLTNQFLAFSKIPATVPPPSIAAIMPGIPPMATRSAPPTPMAIQTCASPRLTMLSGSATLKGELSSPLIATDVGRVDAGTVATDAEILYRWCNRASLGPTI